jgi:hypothetical protein
VRAPISKTPNTKNPYGVAQVVEHLPSKLEALFSNPVPQEKKKKACVIWIEVYI